MFDWIRVFGGFCLMIGLMCLRVFVCLLGILGCCGVGIISVSDVLGFECAGWERWVLRWFWCWWFAGFRLVFSGSLVVRLVFMVLRWR